MVKKHRILQINCDNDRSRKELVVRSEIATVNSLGGWIGGSGPGGRCLAAREGSGEAVPGAPVSLPSPGKGERPCCPGGVRHRPQRRSPAKQGEMQTGSEGDRRPERSRLLLSCQQLASAVCPLTSDPPHSQTFKNRLSQEGDF